MCGPGRQYVDVLKEQMKDIEERQKAAEPTKAHKVQVNEKTQPKKIVMEMHPQVYEKLKKGRKIGF